MKNTPPDEFIEEYWQMRERMDWARSALGRGQDVAQGKLVLAGFEEFYQKWRPLIQDPDVRAGLDAGREGLQALRRHLEQVYLTHLHEVVEARKDWWTAEQLLKMSISFINLMKHAPAQLRPDMEKIHRDYMKKDFDPVTHYQDAEASAAEEEAKFRKALVEFEIDWPERVDAAMKVRLEQLDGNSANAWQAVLAAQIAKVGETPSEKA